MEEFPPGHLRWPTHNRRAGLKSPGRSLARRKYTTGNATTFSGGVSRKKEAIRSKIK
jgi:hypothetical protein